jgi:hypothetical protein
VAAHDWATWHHTFHQLNATCQQSIRPRVLPTMPTTSTATSAYGHATSPLPHQRTVMPRHLYGLYGLHSQRPFFFTCLTIRTDRDISRSRCPFEMKRVALGS